MDLNIIVPFDFSRCAEHAVSYATGFAKKNNGKLILLHSLKDISVPRIPHDAVYRNHTPERKIQLGLKNVADNLYANDRMDCGYITSEKLLPDAINETGRQEQAGLVVMGTNGGNGLCAMITGTRAASVVSRSDYPVIIVPEKSQLTGLKRVAFATDFSSGDIIGLHKIASLLRAFDVHIEVLHIRRSNDHNEKKMETFIGRARDLSGHRHISGKILHGRTIEKTLEEYLLENKADLIAVSGRHHNWFRRLFSLELPARLAMHATVPVLVLG